MFQIPEKAEDLVTILTLTLTDNVVHYSTPVKLFNAIKGDAVQPSCGGVEVVVTVTNGGTDAVNVLFYRTPLGLAAYRSTDSMGNTFGDWDHTLAAAASMQSSRRLDYTHVGSGVTVGIQKVAGVTVNMVATVQARRDRLRG